jgi:hypothetical protein
MQIKIEGKEMPQQQFVICSISESASLITTKSRADCHFYWEPDRTNAKEQNTSWSKVPFQKLIVVPPF